MWMFFLGALLAAGAAGDSQAGDRVSATGAEPSSGDEVVCRRVEVTGSLVKRQRVCHTRATWQKMADAHREHWEKESTMQSGKPGGN